MATDLDEAIAVIQESGLSDNDKARVSRLLRLLDKSSAVMDGTELRQAREAAGLSVGQAARLLGVPPAEVLRIEGYGGEMAGGVDAGGLLSAARVDEVYGLGRRPERTRFF